MSLIEALVTVMVLGTLAAVAYAFLSGVTDSAHTEKARNDVASLNRAVEIFVSNGGSIDPEASAEEVIALLKGHASTEQADYHVGLSGSKIDPRLTPVPVSALESDTPGTRIRWDGSAHRFTVEDDATGPEFPPSFSSTMPPKTATIRFNFRMASSPMPRKTPGSGIIRTPSPRHW